MPEGTNRNIVIIGSSAAGLSAVAAIRKYDPTCRIAMISEDTWPYSRTLLAPYYLLGTTSRSGLRTRGKDYFDSNRIDTFFGQRAVRLEPERKVVVLAAGREIAYDRLLIATGARPTRPGIHGIHRAGVHTLRSIGEARRIRAEAERARQVVVLGGGLMSLEFCQVLHRLGVERVVVVEENPHLLPEQTDARAADLVRHDLERSGRIEVVIGQGVVKIEGDERVQGIMLNDGRTFGCDLLLVGMGVRPRVGFLRGTPLYRLNGVRVDERMRTEIPDVFAAGDVARTTDLVLGTSVCNQNLVNAVEQGRVAGLNMAGRPGRIPGTLNIAMFRTIRLAGFSIGQSTVSRPEDVEEIRDEPDSNLYRKLVFREGQLVGALSIGDTEAAGIYLNLIRRRTPVRDLTDALLSRVHYGALVARSRSAPDSWALPPV